MLAILTNASENTGASNAMDRGIKCRDDSVDIASGREKVSDLRSDTVGGYSNQKIASV